MEDMPTDWQVKTHDKALLKACADKGFESIATTEALKQFELSHNALYKRIEQLCEVFREIQGAGKAPKKQKFSFDPLG